MTRAPGRQYERTPAPTRSSTRTTSQRRSTRTAFTVTRSGSPGPAPIRNTTPRVSATPTGRFQLDTRAPGEPPAAVHGERERHAPHAHRREHREAGGVCPRQIAQEPEQRGEEEPAEPSRRADETGDDADVALETQRYELEHRAVPDAEERQRQPEEHGRQPDGREH